MTDPSSRPSRVEQLFDDYLRRRAAGEQIDFEELCRTHVDLAAELRSLQRGAELLSRLRPGLFNDLPLAERLKREFGADVDPHVSLGDSPATDTSPSSKLFEKLRAEGSRGSRYKLLGEVARGGMGAILEIWDEELRRRLAMKVVLGKDESSTGDTPSVDAKTLGRFLEEAQVTGQLDHPGVVPVHELGLGADGRVYFTMRLVRGEDLKRIFEHVRTGHDGWNHVRALGVMLKVCEAVAYAHSKNVLHRDLKPANVMVGKFGEVYVMDWGLARVLGREDKHDLRLKPKGVSTQSVVKTERRDERDETPDSPLVTMDGDVVGTPSFMPPEQARGELDKLGPHSDVYSIGAMLYQLVTGEAPYVPAGVRVSQHTILLALLRAAPEPIEKLAPATPPELVAICEKAMAREIAERYPTTQELAEDLRAYLENRVVAAYDTSAVAQLRKWIARNRGLAVAAAVIIVLGIVGVCVIEAIQARARRQSLVQLTEVERQRSLAQESLARIGAITIRGFLAWRSSLNPSQESVDLDAIYEASEKLRQEGLPQTIPLDPWGTRFTLDINQGNYGVSVVSAGPDRSFGTGDDIRQSNEAIDSQQAALREIGERIQKAFAEVERQIQ